MLLIIHSCIDTATKTQLYKFKTNAVYMHIKHCLSKTFIIYLYEV